MLTFRGGREVQAYPVSNEQPISEINEALGLGIDQFMAGKKITMLTAPAEYLKERNNKLAGLNAGLKKDYDVALKDIQKFAEGYENSLLVKQLATKEALLKAKARKRQVDIEFPILGSAYKAQKSNNSRELEGKRSISRKLSRDRELIYQVFFALLGIDSNEEASCNKKDKAQVV